MGKPFTVERRMTTSAPPERVHDLVADFHQWPHWSPWQDLDPTMTRTYSGADAGVGARYAWDGDRKAGAGSMEVTADSPDRVEVDLRFTRPFPSRNRMQMLVVPTGDGTAVTWRMEGELSGLARLFSLVRSMDSLVGPDFEKGLARLRQVAEKG